MDKNSTKGTDRADEGSLFDNWNDAIEDGVRSRVREFIEALLEEELSQALARPRYSPRQAAAVPFVSGVRNGHRERGLTGTFGKTRIAVPRARLTGEDGSTQEWRSASLRAYQRRTKAADALIASAYLSGTNTRRVRRALAAVFAGPVGKDVVSRLWRKVKGDWDAWSKRPLAEEPIVRLILDGTVVRVRLDRQATSISLLVALGVRSDGQKVLLAIRNMGGESEAAWRALLDDLVARGLRTPDLLIVDGAPGLEKALAALWPAVPLQRCSESARPCARAPARGNVQRLPRHDLRRISAGGRSQAQSLPAEMAAQMPPRRRQPRGGRRQALHVHPLPAQPVEVDPNQQRHRALARGVQA